MNNERLTKLLDFLKDDPEDPFILYAIATEYRKYDLKNARHYYEILLKNHPEYLGTYYHAAHLYLDMGDKALSEDTFKKGMVLARAQGNSNALRELQNAYNELLLDDED